ncbi:MAG: adenylyltransferase/cytidyltransferase family protein [bacterium]
MLATAPILSRDGVTEWRHATGRAASVAVVGGNFDILHPGNLSALRQAATLGAVCVLINDLPTPDDATSHVPQNTGAVRAELLACLSLVGAVSVVSTGAALARCLRDLQPFTWVGCLEREAGQPLSDAIRAAASQHCDLPRLQGCSGDEIRQALRAQHTPIPVSSAAFPPVSGGGSAASLRPLVTVNGCFDILHIGHARFLAAARAHGASLTVLINSDASVRHYKGPTRPVFPQFFRAAVLRALRAVDEVRVFDGDNPLVALSLLQPAVHVKGGSFEPERVAEERNLLATWGGQLVTTPLVEGFSTTAWVKRA